jgi:anti-sigma B factor antagonist
MNTSTMLVGNTKKITIHVEKFDVSNMKEIKKSIEREIGRKANNIVIDFSRVNFIDSSGLSVIIATFKKIKSMRGQLRLCGLKAQPLQLLKVTQLHKIFTVIDNCNSIR